MKYLKQVIILVLLASGLLSLYFAIINANFFGRNQVDNLNIKKVTFNDNEWHTFINKNGDIDNDKFISAFLLKIENQSHIENISFDFEENKVIVDIWNEFKHYKWFYQLEKGQ
ncbi:hypothetical protein [Mesoplasma tabanidae]|uniref:Uncharacterized protein n=1 Tax=Mesoplasma tabanidae TaxID=219745 RepID=A0A2K8P8A1_9MOLU|nr:hypothetical protein [Mesoplasma tabanidae]ATZ21835.1 hypothetical protein MTABA_v1c06430 [Mesoplasma tabanidae]